MLLAVCAQADEARAATACPVKVERFEIVGYTPGSAATRYRLILTSGKPVNGGATLQFLDSKGEEVATIAAPSISTTQRGGSVRGNVDVWLSRGGAATASVESFTPPGSPATACAPDAAPLERNDGYSAIVGVDASRLVPAFLGDGVAVAFDDANIKSTRYPSFPAIALEAGHDATAIVAIRVSIKEDGRLSDADVYRTSGDRAFDQYSLDAARATIYSAAEYGGTTIRMDYLIAYTYRMMEQAASWRADCPVRIDAQFDPFGDAASSGLVTVSAQTDTKSLQDVELVPETGTGKPLTSIDWTRFPFPPDIRPPVYRSRPDRAPYDTMTEFLWNGGPFAGLAIDSVHADSRDETVSGCKIQVPVDVATGSSSAIGTPPDFPDGAPVRPATFASMALPALPHDDKPSIRYGASDVLVFAGPDGTPMCAELLAGSGSEDFDHAALVAAMASKYAMDATERQSPVHAYRIRYRFANTRDQYVRAVLSSSLS